MGVYFKVDANGEDCAQAPLLRERSTDPIRDRSIWQALEPDELWSFARHRRRGVSGFGSRRAVAPARLWPMPWVRAVTPQPGCPRKRIPAACRQGTLHTDHLESHHNVFPPKQHQATDQRGPTNPVERFPQHPAPTAGTPRAQNPLSPSAP